MNHHLDVMLMALIVIMSVFGFVRVVIKSKKQGGMCSSCSCSEKSCGSKSFKGIKINKI